jgi:hypothetical protein
MEFDLLWKIAVAAAVALLLVWRALRMQERDRQGRMGMLDEAVPKVERAVVSVSPWRYPRVEGLLDGHPARFDLLADTLVTRALPTLWLQLRWVLPLEGSVCVTVDPVGAEFFTDDAACGRLVPPPRTWESRTEVHADASGGAVLRRLGALDLGAYPSLKQLSVLPGELKVTVRCARGERTYYRVLRAAQFPAECVTGEIVDEALSVARAARDVLETEREAG